MMKRIAAITALVAIPLAEAVAEAIYPAPVFEGSATTPTKAGAAQPVHVSVQAWAIAGKNRADEIPLRGFYIAHLISGHISATIDGQTTQHLPGDYWTVKAGGTIQVKVLGEAAVLETTVVSKE